MKIAIVIVEDQKQVMMTPETDHEKQALKFIAPNDVLEAVAKWGSFGDGEPRHAGLEVSMCQGGYLRQFDESESLMFVIKPKGKKIREVEVKE